MIRLLSSDIAACYWVSMVASIYSRGPKDFPQSTVSRLGESIIFDPGDAYHTAGGFRMATSMAETLSFRLLSGRR
jgi:hypothetical protein